MKSGMRASRSTCLLGVVMSLFSLSCQPSIATKTKEVELAVRGMT
jgi:hypothetical protein